MTSPEVNGSASKLSRMQAMQAQFQQKQRADKEQKLLQMIDTKQQKSIQRAALSSQFNSQARSEQISQGSLSSQMNMNITGNGKVRQMFEERRKTGQNGLPSMASLGSNNNIIYSKSNGMKQGIDKSYPLDPLPAKSRTTTSSRSDPSPSSHLTSTTRPMPMNLKTKTPSPPVKKTGQVKSTPLSPMSPTESSSTRGIVPARPVPASASLNSHSAYKTNRPPVAPTNTKYRDYIATIGTSGSVENSSVKPDDLTDRLQKLNVNDHKRDSPSRPSGSVNLTKKSPSPKIGSGGKGGSPSLVKSPIRVASKTGRIKKAGPPGPAPPGLESCKICGRHFAPDRIEKHETICKKTSIKKRKVFDPTKMRMEGTDAESYIKTVKMSSAMSSKKSSAAQNPVKGVDWRKKHEDFINTIRLAKQFQAHIARGGKASDLPPPPPADYSDYIECPHCGRKFSQGAAERHIPKCKNIRSNKR